MISKEFKEKWVAGLRSGMYKQGKKYLRTINDGYCCLGVAADLEGCRWERTSNCYRIPPTASAPQRTAYYYPSGLPESIGHAVAELNDNGASFEKIADWIEENVEAE